MGSHPRKEARLHRSQGGKDLGYALKKSDSKHKRLDKSTE